MRNIKFYYYIHSKENPRELYKASFHANKADPRLLNVRFYDSNLLEWRNCYTKSLDGLVEMPEHRARKLYPVAFGIHPAPAFKPEETPQPIQEHGTISQ